MLFSWLRKRRRVKCEAGGHRLTERCEQLFYQYPSEWGAADSVRAEVKHCRCGLVSTESEIARSTIHSLTMPSRDWEILKKDGRFYR